MITYSLINGIRIAEDYIKNSNSKYFIKTKYGEEYVLQKKKLLKKLEQNENIQDAHECIHNYKIDEKYETKEINVVEKVSKLLEGYSKVSLIKIFDESGVDISSRYCHLINHSYHIIQIGKKVIKGLNKFFNDVID